MSSKGEGLMGRAWLARMAQRTVTVADVLGAFSAIGLFVAFVANGGNL